MGRDHQPKERQRNQLERKKQAQRARCARILHLAESFCLAHTGTVRLPRIQISI